MCSGLKQRGLGKFSLLQIKRENVIPNLGEQNFNSSLFFYLGFLVVFFFSPFLSFVQENCLNYSKKKVEILHVSSNQHNFKYAFNSF